MNRRRLLATLGAAAGLSAMPALAGEPLPFDRLFGGPFTLVDQHGAIRHDTDFRGRFMLVVFGYTACPDVCPTSLQLVSQTMDLLGDDAGRVQPIFVTVDPARDTPELLADYVAHFHPAILGLSGSDAQVRAATRAYKVHRRKVVLADASGPEDYLVDHGSNMYLMGPDGGFLSLFSFRTATPEAMAATIGKYLAQPGG